MTISTNPANSKTSPGSSDLVTRLVRAWTADSLKHETTISSLPTSLRQARCFPFPYSLFPGPYSLVPALVIPITVSTNSPIFCVQSHETTQHDRFFICM